MYRHRLRMVSVVSLFLLMMKLLIEAVRRALVNHSRKEGLM
jgi:hypothetical protein